jgi:hypothetical protein
MIRVKIIFVSVIALLLSGCITHLQSLHPLYTDKDLFFDPALVGTWFGDGGEGEGSWTFEKFGDKDYSLVVKEEGDEQVEFRVSLVSLENRIFLDLFPEDGVNDPYIPFYIPTHLFFRIWIEGDVLRIAMLDIEWFMKSIEENEISIRHEVLEGFIVLTASTEELQGLVLKYADDEQAFPDPTELYRQK